MVACGLPFRFCPTHPAATTLYYSLPSRFTRPRSGIRVVDIVKFSQRFIFKFVCFLENPDRDFA